MIPLYLKSHSFEDPSESAYYLLAANGVFLVKKAGIFSSITEAPLRGLERQRPSVSLAFPKLPRDVLERIYGFFQYAYEEFDGEAVIFLYYCPERGTFHAEAPPQRLTRYRTNRGWRTEGNVEYGAISRPQGFLKLGDAHSHGESPAFFSRTDDHDDGEDGLRIVMGGLHRPQPEMRVSFIANGTRFRLEPEEVLEDFNQPVPPPDAWTSRIECRYEDARTHRDKKEGE
jgi:hypothetical protein